MVWPYHKTAMATMTVGGTYVLDVDSVRKLQQVAKKWGVSKSEALRRSIHSAASNQPEGSDRLQAFRY